MISLSQIFCLKKFSALEMAILAAQLYLFIHSFNIYYILGLCVCGQMYAVFVYSYLYILIVCICVYMML